MISDALKVQHAAEFRRCLIELDVVGITRLWAHLAPAPMQSGSEAEALASLHMARTGAQSVPLKLRQYSDRWLRECGIGSLLPQEMRPQGWRARG
jgi:hypothetical protein